MPLTAKLVLFWSFTLLASLWSSWWAAFWLHEWRCSHPDDRGMAAGRASIHAAIAAFGWWLLWL